MADKWLKYILMFSGMLFPLLLFGQLTVNKGSDINMTPEQFISTYLLGTGINIIPGTAKFNGSTAVIKTHSTNEANQIGNFTTTGTAQDKLNLSGGIILSSGNVANAVTGNCLPLENCTPASTSTESGSDPDLNVLMNPATSKDKSILEFDFQPETDIVTFRYVFSSEEFDGYCGQYNDAFGFLISGPGCGTTPPNLFTNNAENIAFLPLSSNYVTINNICANTIMYSWCNVTTANCHHGSGPEFSYNRFTNVFVATKTVTPCAIYHMKIALGDAGDTQFDSGVFLEENSFSSNNITFNNTYTIPTLGENMIEGCSNAAVNFAIANPKTTDFVADYTLGGSATPDGPSVSDPDYGITPLPSGTPVPTSITIPAGETEANLMLYAYQDANDTEGDETVSFTVTNYTCSGSSSNTNTLIIKNNLSLGVQIDPLPAFCLGESVSLNASVAGGQPVYEYAWNDGSTENPHTVTPVLGNNTYSVNVTDGCSTTANDDILVVGNPPPFLTFPPLSAVCINSAGFTLNTASPAGGTYSGPGVTGGMFIPATAGAGVHTLTYTYSDANGCVNSINQNITVHTLPNVNLPVFQPLCVNSPPVMLSGGTPFGGSYSGPGVVSGLFSPSIAGEGTHTITYTYTDGNGCSNTANNTILVHGIPLVTLADFSGICINAPSIVLSGGLPAGGVFSGTGVSFGNFNPALAGTGSHPITYTVTDGNNCTNFTTKPIQVYELPVITFGNLPAVCVDHPPIVLSGALPPGGSYSGPGVISGLFNPGLAGAGSHVITYTYTDANGCVNSASGSILVNPLPTITLADFSEVCVNSAPVTLSGGIPTGGTYSGNGVSGGIFNPAIAGTGSHLITYSYTNGNGCNNFASKPILVNPLPLVDFSGPVVPEAVCQDYPSPSRYQVTDNPLTTYTWSLPLPYDNKGIVSPVTGFPNMADVSWTGTGSAQIKLQAVTNKGCMDSRTKDIQINAKPVVALSACFDLVTTTNAKPFLLKGGTPLGGGGKYYIDGTEVIGALLNPSTLSVTTHTVSYRYTDANTCISTDSKTLTVKTSNAGYNCFSNVFTDPRNEDPATNKYPTFQVTANGRTTCWMMKNLNWGGTIANSLQQTDNCMVERYCPPNDNTCSSYGSFFQWDELMQYGSTPGWSKGVCPPGWHVPTAIEWQDLIDANQGNSIAGGALKDLVIATGFKGLLNGMFYYGNAWAFTAADNPNASMFWTSSFNGDKPVARGINSTNPSVAWYESSKSSAFPVRCVKD